LHAPPVLRFDRVVPTNRIVAIVSNPAARGGGDHSARLAAFVGRLRAGGCEVRRVATRGPGDGAARAAENVDAGTIVAAGGDGTFREVVEGVLSVPGARPRIGVLAVGTGNDAASLLGLGSDDTLAAAVLGGGERALDVIEVCLRENGVERVRHAVLFVAVGFSGDLLRATTPRVKRWFGARLSYPVGFFLALAGHRAVRLRVRTGRGAIDEPLVVALMANAPRAGGGMMRIAPRADMADGLAEVSLIRGLGRLQIAGQFLRLVRGTHVDHPKVEHFTDVAMEVASDPAQRVALDGDLVGETPMRARLLKAAVRVVAVQGAER